MSIGASLQPPLDNCLLGRSHSQKPRLSILQQAILSAAASQPAPRKAAEPGLRKHLPSSFWFCPSRYSGTLVPTFWAQQLSNDWVLFSAEVQVQNVAFTMISSWEKRGEPSKEGLILGWFSGSQSECSFEESLQQVHLLTLLEPPLFQSTRVYYYCGLVPPAFLPSAHTLFLPLLSPFLIL